MVIAGVLGGCAVELEEAAEQGLEERGACCDDADVELEAVGEHLVITQSITMRKSFLDSLLPDVDPVVESGVGVTTSCQHEDGLEDAHEHGTRNSQHHTRSRTSMERNVQVSEVEDADDIESGS